MMWAVAAGTVDGQVVEDVAMSGCHGGVRKMPAVVQ